MTVAVIAVLCSVLLLATSAQAYDQTIYSYDDTVAFAHELDERAPELAIPLVLTQRRSLGFTSDPSAYLVATNTAGQRLYGAVEPDELADIVGTGAYRTVPGLEGKYFFPTQSQADDFAALMTKADISGPYCTTTGCPRYCQGDVLVGRPDTLRSPLPAGTVRPV